MTDDINDGYTYSGYIEAKPRLHEAVRLKYRRATHRERYIISTAYADKQGTPISQSDHVIAVVCKYVKGWDLKWDHGPNKGQPVPIKAADVGKQEYAIIERCYAMVLRYDGGDPDPESTASQSEASEALDNLLKDECEEDANAKNSDAA